MSVLPLKSAVFFDRDGTLIEDRGYINSFSDVVFYKTTISALRRLKNLYLLFIITNQEGIGLGHLRYKDVEGVHQNIAKTLLKAGVNISAIYCCPHTRDHGCQCIKPKPYFLLKASKEFNVDLTHSFVVGDHPHDMELARSVGARGIFVLTGHGYKHLGKMTEDQEILVAKNLDEAVTWILKGGS